MPSKTPSLNCTRFSSSNITLPISISFDKSVIICSTSSRDKDLPVKARFTDVPSKNDRLSLIFFVRSALILDMSTEASIITFSPALVPRKITALSAITNPSPFALISDVKFICIAYGFKLSSLLSQSVVFFDYLSCDVSSVA